jgi:hypothetical protein
VNVLLGNGDGSFQAPVQFSAVDFPGWLHAADLNGDHIVDLAIATRSSGDINVHLGNGDGSFQAASAFPAGDHTHVFVVADLNDDEVPDIAATQSPDNEISVLLGNGDGSFQLPAFFSTGGLFSGTFPNSIAVADLNDDTLPDLAVATNVSHDVSVLFGNGDGSFQAAVHLPTGQKPSAVVIGDFDLDGAPDLASANSGSGDIGVLLGNGDGSFQAAVFFSAGQAPEAPIWVVAADWDNDGVPDLGVANFDEETVSLLINAAQIEVLPSASVLLLVSSVLLSGMAALRSRR